MEWDTGFLADPKFIHLRDLIPDPQAFAYAGFSYLRLAADAWRTCQRHQLRAIVRGLPDETVAALVEAGLLDQDEKVPEESFQKWVGAALEAREVWRDKQKRYRQSLKTSGDSPPRGDSPQAGREGRIEPIGKDEKKEGVQGEDVIAFIAQNGAFIRPESGFGVRLMQLVDRRGADLVLAEAEDIALSGERLSDRQWVLGLEHRLEEIPSHRQAVEEDHEEDERKRRAANQAKVDARRLEWFRETGQWDEAYGPKPVLR